MTGHRQIVTEEMTFELSYERLSNSSGHWKKQRYQSTLSTPTMQGAFEQAQAEWQRQHKRWNHMSLSFIALVWKVPWRHDERLKGLIDPNRNNPNRRFFFRYRLYQQSLSGTTKSILKREIRADSLFEACGKTSTEWLDLEERFEADIDWIGLYEVLAWKPA